MARRLPGKVYCLLWAQIASQMGDAAFCVLLLWAVLGMTDDKSLVGAVAMFNYLPILLFGMVGGLAADRFPRRGLMMASDGARAAIALSVPADGQIRPAGTLGDGRRGLLPLHGLRLFQPRP